MQFFRAGAPRGFARMGLIAVWLMFWLNTALVPCCEVAAAVLGGHSDTSHLTPLDDGPDSPCGYTLTPGPPVVADHYVLTPDRSSLESSAVDVPVATSLAVLHRGAGFTLARTYPPPSLRLYQRTQRLLI